MSAGVGPGMQTGQQLAGVLDNAGQPAMSRQRGHKVTQCNPAQAVSALSKFYGQVTKGAWWMPWQKMAMKDVASCDKPRRAASRL